jgi:hypothetical protein
MCFGRSKPAPPPPPPAPVAPPAAPPTQATAAVKAARKNEKVAAANLQGRKSTILTGPRGVLSDANVQRKTLLGA